MSKLDRNAYLYSSLVLLYVIIALALPTSHKLLLRYHISEIDARFLTALIIIPFIIVYYMAWYGLSKLKEYSNSIKKTKDGEPTRVLALGLTVLVFSTPVVGIISTIFSYFITRHEHVRLLTIASDYVGLIPVLIGFVIINKGSRKLAELVHKRPSLLSANLLAIGSIIIGVSLCYLVIQETLNGQAGMIYDLPTWAILATVVSPYLYAWFIGMLAVVEIDLYRRFVSGILYRQIWQFLSLGIGAIVLSSMVTQFFEALSTHIQQLSLSWVLVIIVAFSILLAVGYGLIAFGAKQLRKIEDV